MENIVKQRFSVTVTETGCEILDGTQVLLTILNTPSRNYQKDAKVICRMLNNSVVSFYTGVNTPKQQAVNLKDNGWKGANPAKSPNNEPKCYYPNCTAKEKDLREFHGGPKGRGDGADGHKTTCYTHSQLLDNSWYGCGCGG